MSIRPQDLRIGNLIQTKYEGVLIVQEVAPDHIYACKEIGLPAGYYSLPSIEPIQLSEELLILKLSNKSGDRQLYNYDPSTQVITIRQMDIEPITGKRMTKWPNFHISFFKHLHHLQNTVMDLTGEEIHFDFAQCPTFER